MVIGAENDGVVFDWEPTMAAGAEHLGARGTDLRFEDQHRPTRAEKKQDQADRRASKRRVREEMDQLYAADDSQDADVVTTPQEER